MTDHTPSRRRQAPARPLDADGLERLAIFYVGRYATTRSRLTDYLRRKLRERGWVGDRSADPGALVEKLAGLGYVDDAAFAAARAGSLQRRGFGARRVAQALRAAGIGDADASTVEDAVAAGAWDAALTFARRKRLGPYAAEKADRLRREKALGAMMRAGHAPGLARRIIDAPPGEIPDQDE